MASDKAPLHHPPTVPCNVTLKHLFGSQWPLLTGPNGLPHPGHRVKYSSWAKLGLCSKGTLHLNVPCSKQRHSDFFLSSQKTEILMHLQDSIYISDIMVSALWRKREEQAATGIISLSAQESITSLLRQEAIFPFKLHRCRDWQIIVGLLLLLL